MLNIDDIGNTDRPTRCAFIADAVTLLKMSRDNLREAGCRRAAQYVARALKSAQGAMRHAEVRGGHDRPTE